jgi:hypothetical protein
MLHFLNVIEEWADSRKKWLELGAGPESFHVPLLRVPFDSYDIIIRLFNTMGYFVRKAM